MKIRKITDKEELKEFRDKFYERSSSSLVDRVEVPLSYLERSDVYGLFNNLNEMIAGYALGLSPEYRLMGLVPNDKLSERSFPENFKDNDCCEVVCLWKLKKTSSSVTLKVLWPNIYDNVIKSGKKYLLGHNQNEKLDKMYSFFGPHTIYKGISTKGVNSRLFLYKRNKVYIIRFLISTYFPLKYKVDQFFKKFK